MAAPVVGRHRRADARGQPGAHAERGEGHPAVHGAGARRRATASRRAPACSTRAAPSGWRASSPHPQQRPRRDGGHDRGRVDRLGAAHHLGQLPRHRRRAAARQQRLGGRRPLGRAEDAAGAPVVWGANERRQHRLEHGQQRRREHRLEHGQRRRRNIVWSTSARTRTSSGARPAATTRTSSGARRRTLDDNIVWSTATAQNVVWGNDCGGNELPAADLGIARWRHGLGHRVGGREHRLEHCRRRRRTSCGAPPRATTRTSSGAPRRPTTKTSSGARRRRTRWSGRRRFGNRGTLAVD